MINEASRGEWRRRRQLARDVRCRRDRSFWGKNLPFDYSRLRLQDMTNHICVPGSRVQEISEDVRRSSYEYGLRAPPGLGMEDVS